MVYNPMDLTGRAVLVTGASSGLGRATAVLLSRLGARVLLLGRNLERLQETRREMAGNGHALLSFDLNESAAIPDLLAKQASAFGAFAGVVHSAGAAQTKPLRVCSAADFEGLYRVNVVAAAQLLRGVTRRGVTAPQGCSVVVIGSVMSVVADTCLSAYAASKSALTGLVRAAALELARDKVRVNAVLPGQFESPMVEKNAAQFLPEQIRAIQEKHPLGIGRAEDVAAAIAFLLADTARWITGSCLVVDGGYTAQ
jgi:NAD(P)-dependent dehydrogenase (short-subunit alcohol dehydrogenase family)